MLRALGVPARIAVGFIVSVERSEVDHPLIVTDGDAHAWVEVFYENTGWLPLEVTPPTEGRLTQADTNAAAIDAWYYLSRLTGPDRQSQLSKEVKDLVYKARFSQHTLTEKERVRVVSYTQVFADEVYEQSSVFTRFLKKYILGL